MRSVSVEVAEVAAPLDETAPELPDRFHLVALMFQRAKQLHNGARPRVEAGGHKNTRLAQLEILAGLISWDILPEPAPAAARAAGA